ncbi:hypothetical protein AB0H83_39985 [Dactylosporangium sp. NPDC050688]|uniref:hypothetical protein n=1 Tax=Dactylosporangium sp. NPDC050688 TaxID=3157217 RepID=UPI0033C26967
MGIAHRIRTAAAATLLVGAGVLAFTAQPAAAAVTNCVYGWNLSLNQMSATCSTSLTETWYLRLTCERYNQTQFTVNGSIVPGPGRATSIARCPSNTEIAGYTIAYL